MSLIRPKISLEPNHPWNLCVLNYTFSNGFRNVAQEKKLTMFPHDWKPSPRTTTLSFLHHFLCLFTIPDTLGIVLFEEHNYCNLGLCLYSCREFRFNVEKCSRFWVSFAFSTIAYWFCVLSIVHSHALITFLNEALLIRIPIGPVFCFKNCFPAFLIVLFYVSYCNTKQVTFRIFKRL